MHHRRAVNSDAHVMQTGRAAPAGEVSKPRVDVKVRLDRKMVACRTSPSDRGGKLRCHVLLNPKRIRDEAQLNMHLAPCRQALAG